MTLCEYLKGRSTKRALNISTANNQVFGLKQNRKYIRRQWTVLCSFWWPYRNIMRLRRPFVTMMLRAPFCSNYRDNLMECTEDEFFITDADRSDPIDHPVRCYHLPDHWRVVVKYLMTLHFDWVCTSLNFWRLIGIWTSSKRSDPSNNSIEPGLLYATNVDELETVEWNSVGLDCMFHGNRCEENYWTLWRDVLCVLSNSLILYGLVLNDNSAPPILRLNLSVAYNGVPLSWVKPVDD